MGSSRLLPCLGFFFFFFLPCDLQLYQEPRRPRFPENAAIWSTRVLEHLVFRCRAKEKPIHWPLWAPGCSRLLLRLIKASIPRGEISSILATMTLIQACKQSPRHTCTSDRWARHRKASADKLIGQQTPAGGPTPFSRGPWQQSWSNRPGWAHGQREMTWRFTKELDYAKARHHAWKETHPPIHHTGPAGWKSWRSPTSLIPNKILALSWGEKGGSKGEFDLLGLLSTCTGVRAFYSTSCLILPRTHVTEALFPFILISQTK